jgi:hypothetical protein
LKIASQPEFILSSLPRKRFDLSFVYNDIDYLLEFDGQQHFEYIEFFHRNGEEEFKQKQQVDILKTQHALTNGYRLIRIDHTQVDRVAEHIQRAFEHTSETHPVYFSNSALYQYIIDGIKGRSQLQFLY